MQLHIHEHMSASRQHTFLITTLQETPTFYFRELGEIVRIILIYTQTMFLMYIYCHCTTMSVAWKSRRNPLTFLSNIDSLELSVYTIVLSLLQHSSSSKQSEHPKVRSAPPPLLYSIVALVSTNQDVEALMEEWCSPIYAFFSLVPEIVYVDDHCVHEFKCLAKGCKQMVQ